MGRPLRVLVVEDNERDAALLVRELKRGGFDLSYERVETKADMQSALARQTWDVVLSDYALPNFSALNAVRVVAHSGLDLPLIVISGSVGEEAAVEVMREGARDFLFKSKLARMFPVIERELREAARRAQHRETQARMRQMEKMDAIGQLTGGIAHDFNNILAVIIGMAELASSSASKDPQLRAMLQQIDEAAERGAQLVRRLLAFARKQPLQTSRLDLNEAVKRAVAMLDRTLGEDIRLEASQSEELWPVVADPSQLEHALLNLAVNARDAMPGGGRLLFETRNVRVEAGDASENADVAAGDYACISVTDSGTGMPPEIIERIFEPFFTTKEVGKGTGLGLSMVFGFVKQSGGHIKVASEIGRGTSIKLYLPKADQQAPAAEAGPSVADAGRVSSGETILVVEDDASVRKTAVGILDNLGYRVLEASDGRIALEILRGTQHIDLLLTDMVMPNGLSGRDLIRAALEVRPALKSILTSGYSAQFVQTPVPNEESCHFLGKPYRKDALAKAVRAALDGAGAAQGPQARTA